jgi:hypothetical protein
MKLKLIALAAMLAASASSQAAMDGATSGNGSLIANFIYQGGASATTGGDDMSASFDLGVDMNTVIGWNGIAGFTRTWNLSTGQLTGAGGSAPSVPQTIGNYGTAFADLKDFAGASANLIQFNVIALDNTNKGTALTGSRYLSTGDTSFASVNNGQLNAFDTMNLYVNANNALGTHASAANGASTATPADPANSYFRAINGSGTGDNWVTFSQSEDTTKAVTQSQQFWLLTNVSGSATTAVARTPFGFDLGDTGTTVNQLAEFSTWTVDLASNTITFATPVPEAETWAMMVAGLGLMGFMARRRKNNAV